MRNIELPGMIDSHVHLRDFDDKHKEDWETGTMAAVAGGAVTVLDMPNNRPPIKDNIAGVLGEMKPPFGVPGLETTLPLLLTLVAKEKLSLKKLKELVYINPARIFKLKADEASYVQVDLERSWVIDRNNLYTKCGWTPFEGAMVRGRVTAVYLHGQKVFDEEKGFLVEPGFGRNVR